MEGDTVVETRLKKSFHRSEDPKVSGNKQCGAGGGGKERRGFEACGRVWLSKDERQASKDCFFPLYQSHKLGL